MALQVMEQYIDVVNISPQTKRLKDRRFPKGFMDIPAYLDDATGVSIPARVYKRNCSTYWLVRLEQARQLKPVAEPKSEFGSLSMKELRALARARGLKVRVGMTKIEAIAMLRGVN